MKDELLTTYRPALAMLENCIDLCPADLWENNGYGNPFWRIAYHTLFYTDFYLSESPETFKPWTEHLPTYNALGDIAPGGQKVVISVVYSKAQVKSYLSALTETLTDRINVATLAEPCGFPWVKKSKLGLHLYNIRHIQHHTGQLVERLHENNITGINWRG